MKFRPLQDRVLLKRDEADERSKGGIIIPDNAKEIPAKGTVMAVGPGRLDEQGRFVETQVKVGDVVLFGKYAGTEVKVDGEDRLVVREEDILAVLEP